MSTINTAITKCYALHSAKGEIYSILSGNADAITLNTPEDQFATEVAITVEGPTHYIDTLVDPWVVMPKGVAPSKYHTFNYDSYVWEAPQGVETIRADKKAAIEAEFVRRVYEPILYDGSLFDADFTAQFNLNSKVTELAARDANAGPLDPSQLIWRDFANVTHTFVDVATYKTWLNGLIILMSERATVSYMWSWQKKADLAALYTYAEIAAFNPTS